mgnify:CR=1 FL=1
MKKFTSDIKTKEYRKKLEYEKAFQSWLSAGVFDRIPGPAEQWDLSYFNFLLIDTIEKKYILYYTSTINGLYDDPRKDETINVHLNKFFYTMNYIRKGEKDVFPPR